MELSPFELKDQLIQLARGRDRKSVKAMLDAGRGNPNWVAAAPREAFFALGRFALAECRRTWDDGDLAGKPRMDGIARRFAAFQAEAAADPGVSVLADIVRYGVERLDFDEEAWLYELVDGAVGDNYPEPDRMLRHVEKVVHAYLIQTLCRGDDRLGPFDLFATEGATAGICYLFESLQANRLLSQGDRVAIGVPIFSPYLEIPRLDRYGFDVVEIRAAERDSEGRHTWQYPAEEVQKLADPSVKAFFLVNPSNPPSVAMRPETISQIADIVRTANPNLLIISDDVYATFANGFESLMARLPRHTIGVYSLSKYFGVTGWRLGVIAIHRQHICDRLLAAHPPDVQEALVARYSTITRDVRRLPFMERLVADSRQVAMRHTAGLSTPQQVLMALCAGFALLGGRGQRYREQTGEICRRRMKLLYQGLGLPEPRLPLDANYYTEFDLEAWAIRHYGADFAADLTSRHSPLDVLFRLAKESGIVLLPGGGFHGPRWSVRVSLANLDDDAYVRIGQALHGVMEAYVAEWQRAVPVSSRRE
ncbi:MAG: aspartate 4-decarboxylase [Alicyclobacillaceae bacterium]|nr:aspartate 4-decarboxylase [Alicyclobacillaceae bacterium]